MEQTLSIIKPDGVEKKIIGSILYKIEQSGLDILALQKKHLTTAQAKAFYAEHAQRPFYQELVDFMTRGPVVVSVLAGDNAVQRYRDLMGATDPKKAAAGTLRAEFADSIGENVVHGSDSLSSAKREIHFFFPDSALL